MEAEFLRLLAAKLRNNAAAALSGGGASAGDVPVESLSKLTKVLAETISRLPAGPLHEALARSVKKHAATLQSLMLAPATATTTAVVAAVHDGAGAGASSARAPQRRAADTPIAPPSKRARHESTSSDVGASKSQQRNNFNLLSESDAQNAIQHLQPSLKTLVDKQQSDSAAARLLLAFPTVDAAHALMSELLKSSAPTTTAAFECLASSTIGLALDRPAQPAHQFLSYLLDAYGDQWLDALDLGRKGSNAAAQQCQSHAEVVRRALATVTVRSESDLTHAADSVEAIQELCLLFVEFSLLGCVDGHSGLKVANQIASVLSAVVGLASTDALRALSLVEYSGIPSQRRVAREAALVILRRVIQLQATQELGVLDFLRLLVIARAAVGLAKSSGAEVTTLSARLAGLRVPDGFLAAVTDALKLETTTTRKALVRDCVSFLVFEASDEHLEILRQAFDDHATTESAETAHEEAEVGFFIDTQVEKRADDNAEAEAESEENENEDDETPVQSDMETDQSQQEPSQHGSVRQARQTLTSALLEMTPTMDKFSDSDIFSTPKQQGSVRTRRTRSSNSVSSVQSVQSLASNASERSTRSSSRLARKSAAAAGDVSQSEDEIASSQDTVLASSQDSIVTRSRRR
ncbi:hypothetical protein CAOG_08800 [Capsaspora owczarzaki ATCC 30864]|uniref:Uncharacterized protein n=1 Tax=Capsaspora owczarzaki (strain ATCC 30864) TaxID=595528 RepID=A0A0D2WRK8_CAPO3|nr:hypothetical protein CAOG_08800 [Capsaspora owczarzaki ATCC 30864]KJE93908.1 hypothetical protein CAOG_008800 [Capsaspora owczarzaki ATCC 30864]|eukprot:XP_011270440.1 hypothetical protein CAOG_08800 [Capsaspora owczarzaki ATCC 30864]